MTEVIVLTDSDGGEGINEGTAAFGQIDDMMMGIFPDRVSKSNESLSTMGNSTNRKRGLVGLSAAPQQKKKRCAQKVQLGTASAADCIELGTSSDDDDDDDDGAIDCADGEKQKVIWIDLSSAPTSPRNQGPAAAAGTSEPIDLTDDAVAAAFQKSFDQAFSVDVVEVAPPKGQLASEKGRAAVVDICEQHRKDVFSFWQRSAGQLEIDDIQMNEESLPGKPLYERFKRAYDRASDKTIKLVFHGTAEANTDAIQKQGLDPSRRSGQAYGVGEYFGVDAQTSLSYCKQGRAMLIFAVLMDPSGLTLGTAPPPPPPAWGSQLLGKAALAATRALGVGGTVQPPRVAAPKPPANMVVVHKSEHQLPLFKIMFTYKHNASSAYGGSRRLAARARAPRVPLAPISTSRRSRRSRAPNSTSRSRRGSRKQQAQQTAAVTAAAAQAVQPQTWTVQETKKLVAETRRKIAEKRRLAKAAT